MNLTDLSSLSLVPFLMSVHYKPEYDQSLRDGMSTTTLPVRILTDEQAILVVDTQVKLVGVGEKVTLT